MPRLSSNGLPAGVNRAVGSLVYWVNFATLFFVFTKIWPDHAVTLIDFGIIGSLAFALTKIELVLIGFWDH